MINVFDYELANPRPSGENHNNYDRRIKKYAIEQEIEKLQNQVHMDSIITKDALLKILDILETMNE